VIEQQRDVADEQRGIAGLEHTPRLGCHHLDLRRDAEVPRAENPEQRHRRAGAGVEGDRADAVDRLMAEDRHRGDRAVGADGHPGDRDVRLASQVLDGRHQAEVHLAAVEKLRAARGDVEADVEPVGAAMQPVHERPRVEVLDRAEAQPARHPIRP